MIEGAFALHHIKASLSRVAGMKALLHDIADQLHHCAALMSDPQTMRNRSDTVAKQITLTAGRIEQLKVYLQKPADLSQNSHWFDKSILGGVDYLVYETVKRHLTPLYRDFKFPCVFHESLHIVSTKSETKVDLNDEVLGESLTEREIKETNCMGAFVLLFYSLYWHVALIAINRNENPGVYLSGEGEDEDVDFQAELWSRLPSSDHLFEYRRFSEILNNQTKTGAAIEWKLFDDIMIDRGLAETNVPKERVSNAMKIMRHVFQKTSDPMKRQQPNGADEEEGEGAEETTSETNSMIYACLGDCIRSRLDWFGHVMSTFEVQDNISKWEDMCRSFVVQSDSRDTHEKCKYKYEYCLYEVITKKPYSPFDVPKDRKKSLRKFAVYDYGSVSLMMDVLKTLIPLARFTHQATTSGVGDVGQIIALCVNVYNYNTKTLKKKLDTFKPACCSLKTPDSAFHKTKFIDETKSFKPKIHIGGLLHNPPYNLMIDDLAGLYWGCASNTLSGFNNSYLACPAFEEELSNLSEFTKALQHLCVSKEQMSCSEFVYAYLVRLHRNSIFISNISKSLLRFLDVYAKIQARASMHRDVRPLCCLPVLVNDVATAEREFGIVDVNTAREAERLRDYDNTRTPVSVNLSDIKTHLKKELNALESRILRLREKPFNKYPGISWPLNFDGDRRGGGGYEGYGGDEGHGDDRGDNFGSFNAIGKLPVVVRTSRESLNSVADFSDMLIEGIHRQQKENYDLANSALSAFRKSSGEGTFAAQTLSKEEAGFRAEVEATQTRLRQAEATAAQAEAAAAESRAASSAAELRARQAEARLEEMQRRGVPGVGRRVAAADAIEPAEERGGG